MATTEKKKMTKGKKALAIIVGIIAFIAIASVIFINITTLPSKDTEPHHAVGGMVISDTVEYKSDSAKSIRHNPIVRMFQMIWRFCEDGDKAKHAKQTPPSDVVKDVDIPYIDDGNIYHTLDVYYPDGVEDVRSLPIIVDIHGGGWIYGDKNLNEYYCLELAHKGYVVFNISYRLVPDVILREQIQDIFAAMRYINDNYTKYTDNGKMLLTGDSAGGMFAAYTAAIMNSNELQEDFGVDYYENGIKPSALLLTSPAPYMKSGGYFSVYTSVMWGDDRKDETLSGLMDIDKILEKSTIPPSYLITSSGDALARKQTHMLYDLLQEKGIESEIVDFGKDENGKALPHVFSVLFPFDKAGQEAIDGGLAFYQKQIAK